jgi:hypothetical protein
MRKLAGLIVVAIGSVIMCLAEGSGKTGPDAQAALIIGFLFLVAGLSAAVWKD